jgi:hypothetical protein
MKCVLLGAVMLAASMPLRAEIPVSEYDAMKNSDTFKVYISGVGNGIKVASIVGELHGNRPLFCPPEKLPLNQDNYLRFLDDAVAERRKKQTGGDPFVEGLLLQRLQEVFPCPSTPKPTKP